MQTESLMFAASHAPSGSECYTERGTEGTRGVGAPGLYMKYWIVQDPASPSGDFSKIKYNEHENDGRQPKVEPRAAGGPEA